MLTRASLAPRRNVPRSLAHRGVFNRMRRQLSTLHRILPAALERKLAEAAPVAVETTLPVPTATGTRLLNLILCRQLPSSRVTAFENHCPHEAGTLILRDGMLQCRLHGARFTVEDGTCVSGPCVGSRLSMLPVDEAGRGEVVLRLEDLAALRAAGSGGAAPRKGWRPSAMAQAVLDAFVEESETEA